jgi:hypothetical protein
VAAEVSAGYLLSIVTCNESAHTPASAYEPPVLVELGTVAELTLHGCFFGKHAGGSDGFTFMGINAPISNCSS